MRRALGLGTGPQREDARPAPQQERPAPRTPSPDQFSAERRKRRFVQDGEVPLQIVNGRKEHVGESPSSVDRIAAAQAAVNAERAARERAERALQEARNTIRDLQTKLGHAELARREAVEKAEASLSASDGLRAQILERDERLLRAENERKAAQEALEAADSALADERSECRRLEKALQQAVTEREAAEQRLGAGSAGRAGPKTAKASGKTLGPGAKARTPRVAKGPGRAASAKKEREPEPVKWWIKSSAKKRGPSSTKGRPTGRRSARSG